MAMASLGTFMRFDLGDPRCVATTCAEHSQGVRHHGGIDFNPLMSGIEPELAWESLRLFESRVLPALA